MKIVVIGGTGLIGSKTIKILQERGHQAVAASPNSGALPKAAKAAQQKQPKVQEAPLRAHLAFLSSDLLEGRGTGQRGGDLTVAYLETQALAASFGKDWVWAPGDAQAAHSLDAELVFVGYGTTASEEGWNDFKGQNLKGKVLVMMVNDPQPTAEQPNRFGGKALTYYGRWTYKFEEAARQGAAGVLLIHTTPSASYGWSVIQNSWDNVERFQLAQGLASAPPTDKAYNVVRAFEAGWGGVVWKTLGEDPAAVNVSSRYSAHYGKNREVLGFNNIELITDRSLEINLREITEVKKAWPDRAIVVSLMLPCEEKLWADILPLVEATGADGIELNFGCPHGMPERGMGAAVGQVPEYVEMVTRWCKTHSKLPVIVKLTPNITDVRAPARAAKAGGADAVSLINTINSITHLDLDRMVAFPAVGNASTHGGYCGSAVKPIALNMVAEIARDPQTRGLPISGIGGIGNWQDAAEFIALGAGCVQ
eukprot:gene25040-28308_t